MIPSDFGRRTAPKTAKPTAKPKPTVDELRAECVAAAKTPAGVKACIDTFDTGKRTRSEVLTNLRG